LPVLTRSWDILGIPFEFFLFGLTLVGVAVFHRRTLAVALIGLASITLYKLAVTGFGTGPGLAGFARHLGHESVTLANLFLLLTGFSLLSRHFEESRLPDAIPARLPHTWVGGFLLLAIIFVLSAFLDNIAAALIGGTVAGHMFRRRVHIAYLAAIVVAANAGGSGSPVGDTTTTMMWIDGVSPKRLADAFVGGAVAFLLVGIPAARTQFRYAAPASDPARGIRIEWTRIGIVAAILIAAVSANLATNLSGWPVLDRVPAIGLAVWVVLLLAIPVRPPDWKVLPAALKGTLFLVSLVTAASMMPVSTLPLASWRTALGLGFVSAVFDNIPLTALALRQGGYDWGVLAYAVGFGGSIIWFGSSAGVALSILYPESRSVVRWIREGWYIGPAYLIGFFVLLWLLGWHPDPLHR
jgi:Na+/H+ antiporter NhaD/arsenite permease-like protein